MSSTPIRLDTPEAIPAEIQEALDANVAAVRQATSLDGLMALPFIARLAIELEHHLQQQTVRAYHCTKEPYAGFFQSNGLRLTDIATHQAQFLKDHGHIFTQAERKVLETEWESYFHKNPSALQGRNGMIWVLLSRPGLPNDGTERFFEYFGGEAIYWPFVHDRKHQAIADKLKNLGNPVVVELALPASDLNAFSPLARYTLGCYQWRLNQTLPRPSFEATVKRAILASEVLTITSKKRFSP